MGQMMFSVPLRSTDPLVGGLYDTKRCRMRKDQMGFTLRSDSSEVAARDHRHIDQIIATDPGNGGDGTQ